jgi:host factor-I protein
MAFSNRPYEADGNQSSPRRMFRAPLDFKRSARGNGNNSGHNARAKAAPPESTSAENFYYLKQMSAKTPMVIVMTDGEEIHGWIEWYDRNCLKVNRDNAPNLLVQKRYIKYLFKEEELGR